ncbi:MAG: hypothetical protein M1829_003898 [Trizodia sp. TS-e1964]|nr:MAG: hypothetical protein M1829_003898 [Trizodia sp. TS-e1964]
METPSVIQIATCIMVSAARPMVGVVILLLIAEMAASLVVAMPKPLPRSLPRPRGSMADVAENLQTQPVIQLDLMVVAAVLTAIVVTLMDIVYPQMAAKVDVASRLPHQPRDRLEEPPLEKMADVALNFLGPHVIPRGFLGAAAVSMGIVAQARTRAAQPNSPSPIPAPTDPNGGSFAIVGQSGVAAMHAGLLPNGRVVFLDKVENYGQLKLANGQFAYSAEYDPITNLPFPLSYKSNAFCSGGIFLADGRFCSFGGNAPLTFIDPTVGDGFTAIRYLSRSFSDDSLTGQSWSEPGNRLASARWYASAQILGDGTVFVASGSLNGLNPTVQANNNPTYEILDASGVTNGVRIPLDILVKNQPYYMYPFIHLLSDGSLFIFVSKSADLFNVKANAVIRSFPDLPGSFRTYPNTGGSVLLPLSSANNWNPDIVICGGGSYQDATSPTDASCGRIQPFSLNPTWEMDAMPEGRGMVEGTLLPNGHVIWLNGCNLGAQGFGLASNPTLEALIYDPTKPLGQRFTKGPYSAIARLYHSIALLLLDGTILISGSNPVEQPKLVPDAIDKYVTEYRVEIYTPPYLSGSNAQRRPTNINISTKTVKANGSTFTISFTSPSGAQNVKVSLYYGGFVTHSVHMGHRMAFLDTTGFVVGGVDQKLTVAMPPNNHIAPPGPYVIYVCVDDVPGIGQFVLVS